jgi:hypothetical protein
MVMKLALPASHHHVTADMPLVAVEVPGNVST